MTVSDVSDSVNYRTPKQSMKMISTRALNCLIAESRNGLSNALTRKYFQQLMSAIYVCHEIQNQPHCNIRMASILVSDDNTLILDRPNDRARQKGETLDSARYHDLASESMRLESNGRTLEPSDKPFEYVSVRESTMQRIQSRYVRGKYTEPFSLTSIEEASSNRAHT